MRRDSSRPVLGLLAAVVGAALVSGCSKKGEDLTKPVAPLQPEQANAATVSMWRSGYENHKQQWHALLQSESSPVPEKARATFEGPEFFPYAPEWRLIGDLQRLPVQRFDRMAATHGKTQDYLEYGKVPVAANGDTVTLMVYRPLDHPEQYFVPFRDSTTGDETYGGGRYAHLDSLDVHRWVLDFNQSYNPYCAYDSVWICPLSPPANTLPFRVRAGMKGPKEHS
jgi:uncharacterized protein